VGARLYGYGGAVNVADGSEGDIASLGILLMEQGLDVRASLRTPEYDEGSHRLWSQTRGTSQRHGTHRRDVRRCSAQIRIMTGRPPTSRNTLATTFRKLSGTVRSQW